MNEAFITFIYIADLERSDTFYAETLELTLVTEQPECRIYRVSTAGYLGVCATAQTRSVDGVIITLVRNDVEAFCDEIIAKGVELEHPPTHNDRFGITHAFLRDPDGHLIEIQRFDDPTWAESIHF